MSKLKCHSFIHHTRIIMEKRDPTSEGRLRTRASQRVFLTTELAELILRQVPDRTLISVSRVNRQLRELVVHRVPLKQMTSPAKPGSFWTCFRRELQDDPDLSRLQLKSVIEDLLRGRLHERYLNQYWVDIVISASPLRDFESPYSDSTRCPKCRYDITVKARGRAGLTVADVEDSSAVAFGVIVGIRCRRTCIRSRRIASSTCSWFWLRNGSRLESSPPSLH